MAQWLIFVDTNILLDFYRLGGDAAERQLNALARHQDKLILTSQVWMEFLRNRQRVILATVKEMKKPEKLTYPPMVASLQQAKMAQTHIKNAAASNDKVKSKIDKILSKPGTHDSVFKSLSRLFESDTEYTLNRTDKVRFKIRQLARKRFMLGYPPRKSSDTSIGDAVNWEWIIHCAANSVDNRHVLIVSRDTDYGVTQGNEGYLNDWLAKEFKERVSRKRKVLLTPKLTLGLKLLDEQVSAEDEEQEAELIAAELARRLDAGDRGEKRLSDIILAALAMPPNAANVQRHFGGGEVEED